MHWNRKNRFCGHKIQYKYAAHIIHYHQMVHNKMPRQLSRHIQYVSYPRLITPSLDFDNDTSVHRHETNVSVSISPNSTHILTVFFYSFYFSVTVLYYCACVFMSLWLLRRNKWILIIICWSSDLDLWPSALERLSLTALQMFHVSFYQVLNSHNLPFKNYGTSIVLASSGLAN